MPEDVVFEDTRTEVIDDKTYEIHSVADIEQAGDFQKKHTPLIILKELDDGVKKACVSIGHGIEHPQTEEHFIEWIRVFADGEIIALEEFGPNQKPEVCCTLPDGCKELIAQASCNLHGVWECRA